MHDTNWLNEPVSSILSDPLYALLAEEGEDIDPSDPHPALAWREQLQLRQELANR